MERASPASRTAAKEREEERQTSETFFPEIFISPSTEVYSKEFEDDVLSESIVTLKGFGYHPCMSGLNVSLKELSKLHGNVVLHVLNQELDAHGWNLADRTHWQKMRFHEYIELVSLCRELLYLAEKILISNEDTVVVAPDATSERCLWLPLTLRRFYSNKLDIVVFLSSGSLATDMGRTHKRFRRRDITPPIEMSSACVFWVGMSARDFRLLNRGAPTHSAVFTLKCKCKSSTDLMMLLCRRIILSKSYVSLSPSVVRSTAGVTVEFFETLGVLCMQVYGLGFHVMYVNIDPSSSSSTGSAGAVKSYVEVPVSYLSADTMERFPSVRKFLQTSAGVANTPFELTGYQSELVFFLRNSLTSPYFEEAAEPMGAEPVAVGSGEAALAAPLEPEDTSIEDDVEQDTSFRQEESLFGSELAERSARTDSEVSVAFGDSLSYYIVAYPSASEEMWSLSVSMKEVSAKEEVSMEEVSGQAALESLPAELQSCVQAPAALSYAEQFLLFDDPAPEPPSQESVPVVDPLQLCGSALGLPIADACSPIPVDETGSDAASLWSFIDELPCLTFTSEVLMDVPSDMLLEVPSEALLNAPSEALLEVPSEEVPCVDDVSSMETSHVFPPLVDMAVHADPLYHHRHACKVPFKESGPLEQSLSALISGRVLFGSNIDAIGWTVYMGMLKDRFPPFLWCGDDNDVLRLMRQVVEGMTTPQVYLKTPGVWTGGHEENCRFRSLNLNMGPDTCEWFAVESRYTVSLRSKVRSRFGVDIYKDEGSWFPSEEQLNELGIPFVRRLQDPGDCVTLDGAVLHWVRALGFSFHYSWNYGRATHRQFSQAVERYNQNIVISTKNLVPMQTLNLDLAREILNPKTRIGNVAARDVKLVGLILEELTRSVLQLNSQIITTMEGLELECRNEESGSMVLRCQNETCQKEIFGAYVSCILCKLTCLECAGKFCRRNRSLRSLSNSVVHENAEILVKDTLDSILTCMTGLCKRMKHVTALSSTVAKTLSSIKSIRTRATKSIISEEVDSEGDDTATKESFSEPPTMNSFCSLPWIEKYNLALEWLARPTSDKRRVTRCVYVVEDSSQESGIASFQLGTWFSSQRTAIRKGTLSVERTQYLIAALGEDHDLFKGLDLAACDHARNGKSKPPSITRGTRSLLPKTGDADVTRELSAESKRSPRLVALEAQTSSATTGKRKREKPAELSIVSPVLTTELTTEPISSFPTYSTISAPSIAGLVTSARQDANRSLQMLSDAVENSDAQLKSASRLYHTMQLTGHSAMDSIREDLEIMDKIRMLVAELSHARSASIIES